MTESQALLDSDAKVSAQCETQRISAGIGGLVDVEENLGDHADVNQCFEEANEPRKHASALDNGHGADCVQTHVGNPRENDQQTSEHQFPIHWQRPYSGPS